MNGHSNPQKIYFEVTNRCNFRCDFCPLGESQRPPRDMDWALYTRAIDEIADSGSGRHRGLPRAGASRCSTRASDEAAGYAAGRGPAHRDQHQRRPAHPGARGATHADAGLAAVDHLAADPGRGGPSLSGHRPCPMPRSITAALWTPWPPASARPSGKAHGDGGLLHGYLHPQAIRHRPAPSSGSRTRRPSAARGVGPRPAGSRRFSGAPGQRGCRRGADEPPRTGVTSSWPTASASTCSPWPTGATPSLSARSIRRRSAPVAMPWRTSAC